MSKIGIAAVLAVAITTPAVAQNVAPNTGNPQTEVSSKEQGQDVQKPVVPAKQEGVQPDVQAPKPSTSSNTGGNTVGPHTTP